MITGTVAQLSAMFTLAAAAVAGTFIYIAVGGLSKDRFRKIPVYALVFIIVLNIGTFAMVFYHFETPYTEAAEAVWYMSIFTSMIFSMYSSWKMIQLGKEFKKI